MIVFLVFISLDTLGQKLAVIDTTLPFPDDLSKNPLFNVSRQLRVRAHTSEATLVI